MHGTEQENAIVSDWFSAHNYPYFQGADDYASYDLDTAKKLAENGDVRAILRVAELTQKEHGLMAGVPILTDAAVYGSTAAMSSIIKAIEISQYREATTDDQKKAAFFEMVAWAKAAGMRGDGWPINLQIRFLMRYDQIIVSTEEDAHANVRAQEIYDNLQQRRTELGLGNFDNSVPEAVLKYFYNEQQALEMP